MENILKFSSAITELTELADLVTVRLSVGGVI